MMTRQQMLDAINLKIARTSQSEEGTGYFLPIKTADIMRYTNNSKEVIMKLNDLWNNKDYLHEQSDDCVSYIYNLL